RRRIVAVQHDLKSRRHRVAGNRDQGHRMRNEWITGLMDGCGGGKMAAPLHKPTSLLIHQSINPSIH
ncbi:MAG: hypothetical protein NT167_17310, partial [Verrucomicrobia bacterium]|nr:hypothetical protein [Verrucomicrobiota bacterium]